MEDGARHRIELLSPDTAPIHSAQYRVDLKTWQFEKAETKKLPSKYIVEPAQTE